MAKLTPAQILANQTALNALLVEQAKLQSSVSNSLEDYLKGMDKAKKLNETINNNLKIQTKFEDELNVANAAGDIAGRKAALLKLKILKNQTDELKTQLTILGTSLAQVNKTNLVWSKLGGSMLKGVAKLPGLFQSSYGKLKGYGLFEMDKAVKASALQMGLLGKESKSYQEIIRGVAEDTNNIGVGLEQLAQMQAEYTDNLGRNVMLSKDGLKGMAAIAAATGLGAEGTAKMAADMDNQGYSAERTADFVEQTMNDTHKMGLNASKVVKNIAGNMKMLNKYNFKGGVKGLAKMAETVSKLGVDMNFATGMADKLFDIEGAVDMSAQLQVMGGAWAKIADPFKLMFMARNDMEGLTEALGQAAKESVHFNKANGGLEISALEMHKLRKVAEEAGVAYEDLATAGKNAKKFDMIKPQISFNMTDEEKEFITTTAQLDKNGKAFIVVKGEPKLLSELGSAGSDIIKNKVAESKSLAERAKASQNFDDKLTNLINMGKTIFLPIIDGIDDVLGPLVNNLLNSKDFKNQLYTLGTHIADLVKGGATIVKWLAEAAVWLGPTGTIATILGVKGLFNVASWLTNGFTLGKGFMMATGGLSLGKGLAGIAGNGLKAGAFGLAAGAVGMGSDYLEDKAKKSGHEDLGKGIGVLGSAGSGALTGAAIGSLVPVIGTTIGAIVGGIIGAGKGIYDEYIDSDKLSPPQNDAIFNKPIHDGIGKGLGSDFNKGRGIIQGGKITPIDNKDDLLAMKPKGAVANAITNNSPSKMKIEFGDIHFTFDELKVTSPGSPGVAVDLIKDPQFIRNITRMVHSETEKVINGGKNKG